MASGTSIFTKQRPPWSDLVKRICENARSFIDLYESVEGRIQAIVTELGKISDQVKELQKDANVLRLFGAACGGFGLVLGVAALIAGVSSAGDRAADMAVIGCTAAFTGGTAVVAANVVKANEEKVSIETVERLVREFTAISSVLQHVLEEVKQVFAELEEISPSLMSATAAQTETKQFEQLLKQTSDLAERSRDIIDVTLSMQRGTVEMLTFITRMTPTCTEDEQFRNCITDSASQCEKTFKQFAKLRDVLMITEEMFKE